MSQFSEKLIKYLRVDHPDLSSWTIICAGDRAVDPVQHFIHSELGGILPRIEGLNSYITRQIAAGSSLQPLPGDERLLYFIQFIARRYPDAYTKALLRSIPNVDSTPRVKLPTITGSIPHPFNKPTGCPFHPRCESAMAGRCDVRTPALRPVDGGQSVSCFLYHDVEVAP